MKFISLKVHGILDFVTVVGFAAIPSLLPLSEVPTYLCYTLAVVHFLMTVFSDFPFGIKRIVPMKFHKLVEIIVGPTLIIIPWLLGFSEEITSRYVFLIAGAIIIAVGMFTNYETT